MRIIIIIINIIIIIIKNQCHSKIILDRLQDCVFTQGSAFWGSEHSIFTFSPSKPHFWAYTMESLWEIHICITA